MKPRLELTLLHRAEHDAQARDAVVTLPNDADPFEHAEAILATQRVELHFPQFTDGRAFSQAYLIRRRLGFKGDLRACGDVLPDQVLQIARTGFSSAVLQDGVSREEARAQLMRFGGFYQGDVTADAPFHDGARERHDV
ncbi:DUF934 domain-containing protein [Paraburkholderia tropica]|uniref:Uncharacterized conserved protein, DUF934 family n=1 Tax=Paraburkholderia tropica TaxID=92647 RepID=A0AAQ1JYB5_9BURK|nr:DUF934 domain-containing protein [Paraburkholderia tropica]RQN33987.1 DUF934 domain-containing protein [Paraburkholderia tropica]SEK14818.1 Uncharacterized conserved protein, DUF934 family [Paraburkholderia tropica]